MRTCQDKSLQLFKLLNFRCLHRTSQQHNIHSSARSHSHSFYFLLGWYGRSDEQQQREKQERMNERTHRFRSWLPAFSMSVAWYSPKLSPVMHTIFEIIDRCQRGMGGKPRTKVIYYFPRSIFYYDDMQLTAEKKNGLWNTQFSQFSQLFSTFI